MLTEFPADSLLIRNVHSLCRMDWVLARAVLDRSSSLIRIDSALPLLLDIATGRKEQLGTGPPAQEHLRTSGLKTVTIQASLCKTRAASGSIRQPIGG